MRCSQILYAAWLRLPEACWAQYDRNSIPPSSTFVSGMDRWVGGHGGVSAARSTVSSPRPLLPPTAFPALVSSAPALAPFFLLLPGSLLPSPSPPAVSSPAPPAELDLLPALPPTTLAPLTSPALPLPPRTVPAFSSAPTSTPPLSPLLPPRSPSHSKYTASPASSASAPSPPANTPLS